MSTVTQGLDRIEAVFDEGSLVADAGLVAVGTLVGRLGLEELLDDAVRPLYDGIVPDPNAPLPTFTEDELHELVNLMKPQRDFRTSVQSSVEHDGETKYLFDVPSTETGVVEARVVVDTSAGEWRVSEVFACISTLVTDFDRFKELRKKEVAL